MSFTTEKVRMKKTKLRILSVIESSKMPLDAAMICAMINKNERTASLLLRDLLDEGEISVHHSPSDMRKRYYAEKGKAYNGFIPAG